MVMVAPPAAAAPASSVAAAGGPGWGTSWPATLGWRCTQGSSWTSLRHQRVAKADTRGTLATKGIIVWVQGRMSRSFCGWLRSTAEAQLRHRVAVGGPSQKTGGLFGACSRLCLGTDAFAGCLGCPLRSDVFPTAITVLCMAGLIAGAAVGAALSHDIALPS